jgi:CelD/BcsL family acetyltransferase involved in cellulose biosynthesis
MNGGIPFADVRSRLTGHRWISLPFSDHCAPLCSTPSVLESLVAHLIAEYGRKAIPRVEIRWLIPGGSLVRYDERHVLHTLKLLDDPEAVMKTFDRTRVRQPLKQAAQRGVEIRWATEKSDIFTFYDMLVETRRRHGAPVQPRRFFDLFWDRIISAGLGFLLLAYKGREAVGGTVFAHYGGTLTGKYNASAPEQWHLRTNNSLTWTAIKWGCEHGFSRFDFGRTETSSESLRGHKDGWGTVEEPLIYSVITDRELKSSGGRLDRLMKLVIRHSPPAVCRLAGEVMYKHYA